MTDELVSRIVRQVMAAMGREGVAAPAEAQQAPSPDAATKPKAARPPQKTFLTAEVLLRRLAATDGDGRAVELASHEFLTPAAKDVVDERHLAVRRAAEALPKAPPPPAGAPAPRSAPSGAAAHGDPAAVGLMLHKPSETVRSVLAALRHDRLALVDYSQTDCWVCNVRLLCEAIAGGVVGAGAAILPYAADAMVLANKVRGIRAVQGTRPESVNAAMRHFAPNLLVIEHTLSTYHEMRAMVRTFAAPRGGQPQAARLMENIAELERS
ncbi:MAG TPA: RpiB/LacA/LacB family sugar-phosphate isomerase [Phycisphaerae bacterium]|nr:RpiB/LacA/LacB family sugar-phosphate isomerase [Phycisphaerae bacterium]